MKKVLLWLFAGILFAAGFALLVFPSVKSWLSGQQTREEIAAFQKERVLSSSSVSGEEEGGAEESGEQTGSGSGSSRDYAALLQEMQEYNARIYQEHQTSLKDAWSFEENAFDFQSLGLPEDMAGYITIDAMDLELPLYVGATEENMRKGAVILGQTSMPIGGENTNCVIAAHRGYRGIPFFREIERLQPGDLVQVTNFWGTLNYRVVKSIVVEPDEIEAVKILEGQDMVTLVSCHPYTKNYLRYIVYCVRDQEDPGTGGGFAMEQTDASGSGSQDSEKEALTAEDIPFEGVPYTSSEQEIREEQTLNRAGLGMFAALLALLAVVLALRGRRKSRK